MPKSKQRPDFRGDTSFLPPASPHHRLGASAQRMEQCSRFAALWDCCKTDHTLISSRLSSKTWVQLDCPWGHSLDVILGIREG